MTSTAIHMNATSTRSAPRISVTLGDLFAEALRLITPAAPSRDPAAEAARVRDLANSYAKHDPRFAADLYAAADRHEQLHAE